MTTNKENYNSVMNEFTADVAYRLENALRVRTIGSPRYTITLTKKNKK